MCSAGSKLLIQESIFEKFCFKLKTKLGHYRIGHSLDKAIDMGALVSEAQLKTISGNYKTINKGHSGRFLSDSFQIKRREVGKNLNILLK